MSKDDLYKLSYCCKFFKDLIKLPIKKVIISKKNKKEKKNKNE